MDNSNERNFKLAEHLQPFYQFLDQDSESRVQPEQNGQEKPENFPGGILLAQAYRTSPSEVNSLLFSPASSLFPSLAKFRGSTKLKLGLGGLR